jgi:hypothetical protein
LIYVKNYCQKQTLPVSVTKKIVDPLGGRDDVHLPWRSALRASRGPQAPDENGNLLTLTDGEQDDDVDLRRHSPEPARRASGASRGGKRSTDHVLTA